MLPEGGGKQIIVSLVECGMMLGYSTSQFHSMQSVLPISCQKLGHEEVEVK